MSLLDIKKTMRKSLEGTATQIDELHIKITEYAKITEKQVIDFSETAFVAHKIAEKVSSGKLGKKESLELIHKSMWKTQDLLTFLKLQILPRITDINSDVKLMLKASKIEAKNDEKFLAIKISTTQRKEELDYVTMDVDVAAGKVQQLCNKIKDYIEWVDEQMAYLNRLDSMIRLGQRIDEHMIFNGSAGSGTIEI